MNGNYASGIREFILPPASAVMLQELYSLTSEEAKRHLELMVLEYDCAQYLVEGFVGLFDDRNLKNVGRIRHAVAEHIAVTGKLHTSETVQKIMARQTGNNAYVGRDMRRSLGVPEPPNSVLSHIASAVSELITGTSREDLIRSSLRDDPTYAILDNASINLPTVLSRHQESRGKTFQDIVDVLSAITKKSSDGAALYLEHFLDSFTADPEYGHSIRILEQPDILLEKMVCLKAEDYVRVGDQGIACMDFFADELLPAQARVSVTAKALYALDATESASDAISLLQTVTPVRLAELREMLFKDSTLAGLSKRMQRSGMLKKDYIDFLFEDASLITPAGQLIAIVKELAQRPSTTANAVFMAKNGIDALRENSEEVMSLARERPDANIILGDYVAMKRSGEQHKARLALDLSIVPSQKVKPLRAKLTLFKDEDLTLIDRIDTSDARIAFFEQLPSGPQAGSQKKAAKVSWYDRLSLSLSDLPQTGALVDAAYNALPDDLRYQLKNVWTERPELLEIFSTQALEHGRKSQYRVLLSDPSLFSQYLDHVDGSSFRKKLKATLALSNPYGALKELLKEDIPDAAVVAAPVQAHCGVRKEYDRVLIFGGHFDHRERELMGLKMAIPFEIIDKYDLTARSQDKIRNNDLVVYMTQFTSHPDYHRVKEAAKGVADFMHFGKSNADLLVNSIHEYMRNKATTVSEK